MGDSLTALEREAATYVWGRQDAGEGERDTMRTFAFAEAYRAHAQRFQTRAICGRSPLQTAWERWVCHGDIETVHQPDCDHHGSQDDDGAAGGPVGGSRSNAAGLGSGPGA
ncbi:hypothetical protein [Pilimelia columellifera]|uniref:Uncharacterized protein n=1 Tax=Pilimelia columellifera subsp. columellifera TaxID=706583 RepID=A0ABP6ASW6_9ACTN